jgi:hypothetical protein
MRFEAVLAQAEVAGWVGVISMSAATIVVLGIGVWEIRRAAAERQDRNVSSASPSRSLSTGDHPSHRRATHTSQYALSGRNNVLCLWALLPLGDFEADLLALL